MSVRRACSLNPVFRHCHTVIVSECHNRPRFVMVTTTAILAFFAVFRTFRCFSLLPVAHVMSQSGNFRHVGHHIAVGAVFAFTAFFGACRLFVHGKLFVEAMQQFHTAALVLQSQTAVIFVGDVAPFQGKIVHRAALRRSSKRQFGKHRFALRAVFQNKGKSCHALPEIRVADNHCSVRHADNTTASIQSAVKTYQKVACGNVAPVFGNQFHIKGTRRSCNATHKHARHHHNRRYLFGCYDENALVPVKRRQCAVKQSACGKVNFRLRGNVPDNGKLHRQHVVYVTFNAFQSGKSCLYISVNVGIDAVQCAVCARQAVTQPCRSQLQQFVVKVHFKVAAGKMFAVVRAVGNGKNIALA